MKAAIITLITFEVFLFAQICYAEGQLETKISHGHKVTGTANTKHQVSLRLKLVDNIRFGYGHICGGSLISSNGVLTAGHCVKNEFDRVFNFDELVVVMGTLTRFVSDENTLVINVKSFVLHPKYYVRTFANDIAYIFLDGSVPDNHPTIHPISLVRSQTPMGIVCDVTGWGLTEEGILPNDLMAVDVPLINITQCKELYGDIFDATGKLCAGYLNIYINACQGDSGGPLVCNGLLTGIVSFNRGSCEINSPPLIYTDVFYFRDWITETASGNGSGNVNGSANGNGSGSQFNQTEKLVFIFILVISFKLFVN